MSTLTNSGSRHFSRISEQERILCAITIYKNTLTPDPELSLQVILTVSHHNHNLYMVLDIYTFKILKYDHLTYYYAELKHGDDRKTYNNTMHNVKEDIYRMEKRED